MREHRALGPPGGAGRVEDHRGVFFADVGGRLQRPVRDQARKLRRARVVIDRYPVHQVGNVACLGQPVGERSLMDQEFRAAIGQHIGDLRLLLPGAEQHRDGAEMRRAEQRQHEFDAVAEQQRDSVATLYADLPQARRDLSRLLRHFAPAHAPVAADQRLAVRVS